MATKEETVDRIRNIYERAVRDRSGVSYILTEDEAGIISQDVIRQIEDETGYRKMRNDGPAHQ